MRRWAVLVAVGLALLVVWRALRPVERSGPAAAETTRHEEDSRPDVELLTPERFDSEPEAAAAPASDASPARRTRLAPDRTVRPPPRAPVRGRLYVAETGDPILESLSVHLRTIELDEKEDFVTRPDGTFTSTLGYERGLLLARVKNEDGRELVDHEGRFDPTSSDEWPVYVPVRTYPTVVRGTVVDRSGDALGGVLVQLVPLADASYAESFTNYEGDFELRGLRAGPFRLHLQGPWLRSAPVELALHAGTNELGELVLPEPETAEVVLRFTTAEGAQDESPQALPIVRPSSSSRDVPFWYYGAIEEDLGGGRYEQRLARVPAVECTLTLESLDGRSYEPARFVLTPPATIEVHMGGKRRASHVLRVRDAVSGEPILAYQLWARRRGAWELGSVTNRRGDSKGELDIGGKDAWVVLADGHCPLRGVSDPEGSGVVEVALERCSGQLWVFEDLEGDCFGSFGFGRQRTLLHGIELYVEGAFLGRSDELGQILVDRDAPPEAFEIRSPGWRVVKREDAANFHRVGLVRQP